MNYLQPLLASLLLFVMSCGAASKASKPLAEPGRCEPLNEKPELRSYTVAQSGDPEATQTLFVASFPNQACERRLVYLQGCQLQSAQELLGLLRTDAKPMSEDEWKNFEGPGGDFHRYPHLSCTPGSKIDSAWPAGSPPEVHIVSGQQGYSSLAMKADHSAGSLHYSIPNHCFGLSRKLRASYHASQLPDPRAALSPLTLRADDENVTITCAHEPALAAVKQGWSISSTGGDPSDRVYMLRYNATISGQSHLFYIRRVDNESVGEENTALLEESLSQQFQIPVRDFTVDSMPPADSYRLFDYCTRNCDRFEAQHYTFSWGEEEPFHADPVTGSNQLQQFISKLHEVVNYLPLHDTENWTFDSCRADQSLQPRLGFTNRVLPRQSWFEELYAAARHKHPKNLRPVPCTIPQTVCRVALESPNLSATLSTGNSQISTLMNRPKGCEGDEARLEIVMNGTATVTDKPWIVGNLPEFVQKKWQEIRIIGNPGATISQTVNCERSACGSTPKPALQIIGEVPIRLENVAFVSNVAGTARTIAVQRMNTAEPAVTRIHNIKAENFNTGFLLQQSATYMTEVNVKAYHKGILASGGSLSLIGANKPLIKLE
ncbi:MAG: hypothetical protein M3Q07_24230, partial [Pseudobdellovibrionaceae bacterium]|nr:hypothetical protein [Pseudobdellovibrionaceae bacterium]